MHSFALRAGRWPLALTLVAASALGVGCAQPAQFSTNLPAARPAPSYAQRDVRVGSTNHTISAVELGSIHANSTFDVVARLRPEFLRHNRSGIGAAIDPAIFIDELPAGPLSVLREIDVSSVAEIRYMTPSEAFLQRGSMYSAGIIFVRLRR